MPTNKRSKYRGSRTCGGGTHKNRRGAGNRGGRGRAGINAHHFVKWYKEMGGPVFGKNGFCNQTATEVTAIDVGTLDQIIPSLLAQGIAKQDGDTFVINAADMGIDKVLGLHIAKVDDYIAKPFSPQELLDSVEKVLASRQVPE